MNGTKLVSYILKGLGLLILDVITFLLVFTVWAFVNIPVFPWAIGAIVLSLVLVNVMILLYGQGVKTFGLAAATSSLITTILYYLFVMFFTGFSYITISPKWYSITFLFATLLYVVILSGLYASGRQKAVDMGRQETEQDKVLVVNFQLMNIEQTIKETKGVVEEDAYGAMLAAFDRLSERLKASTPFGRATRPAVIQLETQITTKLNLVQGDLAQLKAEEDMDSKAASVAAALAEIKDLVLYRERMMVQ